MAAYRWVTLLRRLQKKGWGSGPLSPFLLRPPDSVRTYLLLMPWMKMASRAQQRRFASPSSLVTTSSDVTYRFCRALSDWASLSLIYVTMSGRRKYYQFPCLLSKTSQVRWSAGRVTRIYQITRTNFYAL